MFRILYTALLDQKSRRPGDELCPTIAEIRSKLRVVCFGRELEWVAADTGVTFRNNCLSSRAAPATTLSLESRSDSFALQKVPLQLARISLCFP